MPIALQLSSVVGRNGTREVHATAGIDILAVGAAPIGDGVGVDVRLNDNVACSQTTLAELLRLLLPLLEGSGEGVAVDENGFQSLVIRLTVPGEADDLDGLSGHGFSQIVFHKTMACVKVGARLFAKLFGAFARNPVFAGLLAGFLIALFALIGGWALAWLVHVLPLPPAAQ